MERAASDYRLAALRSGGARVKERYVPIRPGISEHLLRGDISVFEFGVYVIVHLQADFSTGIWRGSAPRILNSAPRGAKLRDIQRALEHLTDLGLLKHFHQHGQRGNFAFLINKFTVRSGALSGMRLNADKSESWRAPVYESCADDDADDDAHGVAESAPIQEVRKKKEEERTKPAAKPAPPSDSRHQGFFDCAYQVFKMRYGQPPTWAGREGKQLQAFLKSTVRITQEEWEQRYRNFLKSTSPFYSEKCGSLLFFISNFDHFIDGPVLERKSNHGKPNANEAVAITMQGAAANARRPN